MDAREKMKKYRKDNGINLRKMSRLTKVSTLLLSMVENGDVTHPNIARRIQKAYKLTNKEVYELMPANYNPNGRNYDPDMFKIPDPNVNFIIRKAKKYDEYEDYMKHDKKWREPNG